jgi:hypothetical protein
VVRDGRLRQTDAFFNVSSAKADVLRDGRSAWGQCAALLEHGENAAAGWIGDGSEAAVERRGGCGHEVGLEITAKLTLVNMQDRRKRARRRISGVAKEHSLRIRQGAAVSLATIQCG